MTISQAYRKYKILPSIQTHMLKVAGVGAQICEALTGDVSRDDIVEALALHDIGKIVTVKLGIIPNSLGKKSLDYWLEVQKEIQQKYGGKKTACVNICHEIGVSARVIDLVESVRFSYAEKIFTGMDLEKMICIYSDQRVSPFGVASLEYRMEEGRVHHRLNKNIKDNGRDQREFDHYSSYLYKIEEEIFRRTDMKPEDITDDSVFKFIPKIKKMKLN